jgi:hypothetical protein
VAAPGTGTKDQDEIATEMVPGAETGTDKDTEDQGTGTETEDEKHPDRGQNA